MNSNLPDINGFDYADSLSYQDAIEASSVALLSDTPRELLQIKVSINHLRNGVKDDPCHCPLALAIQEIVDCTICEVLRDSILIDGNKYNTSNKMQKFIEFFDAHGPAETHRAFHGVKASEVFLLQLQAEEHYIRQIESVVENGVGPLEEMELDGIDPNDTYDRYQTWEEGDENS